MSDWIMDEMVVREMEARITQLEYDRDRAVAAVRTLRAALQGTLVYLPEAEVQRRAEMALAATAIYEETP